MDKTARMKRAISIKIKACEALLDYYEGNDESMFAAGPDRPSGAIEDSCPLCRAGNYVYSEVSSRDEGLILRCNSFETPTDVVYCLACPWTRFMGRTCYDFVRNDDRFSHIEGPGGDGITNPGDLKKYLDGEWVDMRIEQLECWIKEMKRMCAEPGGLEDYFNATA